MGQIDEYALDVPFTFYFEMCQKFPKHAQKYFGFFSEGIDNLQDLVLLMPHIDLPKHCPVVKKLIDRRQNFIDQQISLNHRYGFALPYMRSIRKENREHCQEVVDFIAKNHSSFNIHRTTLRVFRHST